MITEKARELSKIAHEGIESFPANWRAQKELEVELTYNCDPTLEEFLELIGDLIYKPEIYYDIWIVKRKILQKNRV